MKSKSYEDLTFADNFMFCKIMSTRKDLCKELIELILGVSIKEIKEPTPEKSIEGTYESKGIRLDVYVDDEEGTVYDLEMQTADLKHIPKRTRYYQGMIDLNLLKRGEKYKKLSKSYIIFICTADPFGLNLPMYTFRNTCQEDKTLIMEDGATRIVVNAAGIQAIVSEELGQFMNLLLGRKAQVDTSLAGRIYDAVLEAKEHRRWREEYKSMISVFDDIEWEAREEGLAKGRAEGRAEGIEEGRKEGIRMGEAQMIKQMITNGTTKESVAFMTGKSVKEIEELLAIL